MIKREFRILGSSLKCHVCPGEWCENGSLGDLEACEDGDKMMCLKTEQNLPNGTTLIRRQCDTSGDIEPGCSATRDISDLDPDTNSTGTECYCETDGCNAGNSLHNIGPILIISVLFTIRIL